MDSKGYDVWSALNVRRRRAAAAWLGGDGRGGVTCVGYGGVHVMSARLLVGAACWKTSCGVLVKRIFRRGTGSVVSATKERSLKKKNWDIPMTKAAKDVVDTRRVRTLFGGKGDEKKKTGPVVYWMNRDQRIDDNWAFLYAAQHARELSASLCVVFSLADTYCGFATARHRCFMLKGLREVASKCSERGVGFAFLRGDPADTIPSFIQQHDVRLVVCDMNPMVRLHVTAAWPFRKRCAVVLRP